MSVQEVGIIRYFSPTHLNWHVPRYLDFLEKDSSRTWSPKFAYPEEKKQNAPSPPKWPEFFFNSIFMKISITSDNRDKGNINCVRVGVTDESRNLIDFCDCIWNDSDTRGKCFDGLNLIRANELMIREKGEITGYLRLFCEIPKEACRQLLNVATQTKAENDWKLQQDFKTLLMSNKDSDLTIKIKEREFNVHRAILRARSSVFDSMLSHDVKENREGVIEIEDCEPDVFEEFLNFVYSGKIENINSGNAHHLYYAADKYNTQYLKNICVNFMKESVSVENICEIICLATKHSETSLLKFAIDYFAKNLDKILITCNWLQFMKDNPVEANELYIKSLKLCYMKTDKNE